MPQKKSDPKKLHKPWPLKKRIIVSAIATFVILLLAFSIGTGLYALAKSQGLVQSQSLKHLVFSYLQNDPEFQQALDQEFNYQPCHNPNLPFTISYSNQLIPAQETNIRRCLQFNEIKNPDSREPALKLNLHTLSKNELTNQLVSPLNNVITEPFNHPHEPAVRISAFKDGIRYYAYLIQLKPGTTLVAEYYPANPKSLPAIESTLKTVNNKE